MYVSWQEIAERALDDWEVMETLENGDKQMLYAFHSFCPTAAKLNHLVLRMTESAVKIVLESVNQAGGIWHDPHKIPFDASGQEYVFDDYDEAMFGRDFGLWRTRANQEVVYTFAEERFDEQSFAAILSADTTPEIVRQIDQLHPYRYIQCLDAFLQLLPELGWMVIMLKPTGDYGIFVVDSDRKELVQRVSERLRFEGLAHFELTKGDQRYYWKGPTEWD